MELDCATFLVLVWDPLKCSEKKLSTALCMDILWNEVVNSSSTAPSGRVRNGWKYASTCNPHPPVGLMWIFSTSVRTSAKVSDLSHWECIHQSQGVDLHILAPFYADFFSPFPKSGPSCDPVVSLPNDCSNLFLPLLLVYLLTFSYIFVIFYICWSLLILWPSVPIQWLQQLLLATPDKRRHQSDVRHRATRKIGINPQTE